MKNYLTIIIVFTISIVKAERYAAVWSNNIGKQTNVSLDLPFGAANVVHWADPNVSWYLNSAGASGEGIDYTTTWTQINNAFYVWDTISSSTISFTALGSTPNTWSYDDTNTIYWAVEGDDVYDPEEGFIDGPNVLATTILVYNSSFELLDVDIVFNGRDHPWNITGINGPDIQAVATHEIGHMIGLHHTGVNTWPYPVMYRAYFGIEQRNIRDDDRVGASFLYGGNIITDKNFENPQNYFYWDVNVNTGKTLTINENLKIYNNSDIKVNGELNVNGTSSNDVVLDFISKSSNNGIKIYSGGSTDIDYAEIKNAYYGVYCNEGELEISNSDIKDCSYGLYLYRTNYALSQPDITNCNIYKTSYNGSGTGIYCNYSSPTIINTNVSNYYTGIGTIYNSSPLLGHYTANGNNKLYDNYKNLHAISSSNPFLGTTSYGGYNTLRDYINKNLIAQTNCNIYAENNYWGSTNSSIIASGISIYSGCSVDYVPFITWDPNGSSKLPDNKLEKSTNSDVVVSNGELSNIQLLILSGKLEEALTESKTLLAESSGEAETLYALDLMWQIERKMKTEKNGDETDLFADIRNKEESDLSQLYVNLIDAVGVIGKSRISALDNVLQKSGDNETIEKGVIYAKMLYYYNEEIDIDKAKEQYQLLAEKYPNAPITKEALFYLDGATSNSSQNKLNEEIAAEFNEMPDTYSLFSNYPNPFNPTTTISYSIPRVSNVSLVIYDMMGREVKVFEKTGLSAGVHSFVWDGTNNNGALVTSGIYISKFRAISQNGIAEVYEKTGKLMLLK